MCWYATIRIIQRKNFALRLFFWFKFWFWSDIVSLGGGNGLGPGYMEIEGKLLGFFTPSSEWMRADDSGSDAPFDPTTTGNDTTRKENKRGRIQGRKFPKNSLPLFGSPFVGNKSLPPLESDATAATGGKRLYSLLLLLVHLLLFFPE